LTDQVRAEIEVARLELDEAAHVVHLYDDRVLPASRDQLAAARAGFETGANPMLALIDAERSLLAAELGRHQAVAAYASRHAELTRALGLAPRIPDIPDRPDSPDTPAGPVEPPGPVGPVEPGGEPQPETR
jgi:outer membrane protein TolC